MGNKCSHIVQVAKISKTLSSKKRPKIWVENPDPSTEMAKQPQEWSISSEEKGGGESPEVEQVSQVGSAHAFLIAQAIPFKVQLTPQTFFPKNIVLIALLICAKKILRFRKSSRFYGLLKF